MSSFISPNLTEIEAITGCTFAYICNTVFRMFSCLQINCQPFYFRQLLKFNQFDWLIEIYLQTEGHGTHHKMVSLQPMSGFPLCYLKPDASSFDKNTDVCFLLEIGMGQNFEIQSMHAVRTKCLGAVSGATISSEFCLEAQSCNYILASF